jgi:hypothetical protein
MATFESSLKSRLIYVFAIQDEWHKDCLKIGETTLEEDHGIFPASCSDTLNEAAHKRIDQYTTTAGIAYTLLYTEMTVFFKNGTICSFNDKQVHSVLERSGVKKKIFDTVKGANEWYCCDLETVKKAIAAVKQGLTSLHPGDISTTQNPIIFRPEQQAAIDKTKKVFRRGNQMLWNAKMRFGKTLCALRVARDLEMKRTMILTHRPVVDEGWFEDFGKIFYDRPDYHYGSRTKGESFKALEYLASKGDRYVYFASMQDMRGSELVGGKFDKNNELFSTSWDFLIIDEAHEGTQTELGKAVIEELTKADTKVLQLSGTPFNLLDEHSEDEIFTWDYVMEQRAKAEWDIAHMGDPNPYESLPAINIYTYDLGRLMNDYADDEKAFNFREFFRTREDDTFVHEHDVDNFLTLLCRNDKDSLYPYSNDEYRRIFRHTLWILPGVKAARALSAKLKAHPVFGLFEIVNVAGNGDEDEENADALQMVNNAIGSDPDETYTITLSCGRLTTGVSIKPWTAVFMMAGSYSTSAANYMQTIFRVQTPFSHKGRMKQQCYAFDFAPDRTLRVLAEAAKVSAKVGKATDEDRKILGDFLNFCPIISIDGSKMKPYDVNKMMGQLKKAQIEKVVQCGFEDGALYNDELLKLTDVDLTDFKDLKGIIGKTKAMTKTGDIDVNSQGFTNEEYEEKEKLEKKSKKDRTEEEQKRLEELKQKHNQRKEAISILRGISIRMPLLIFGAELTNEDDEITIDNFANLVDDQSWEEFMPKGVTKRVFEKFKRFYEPDVFREAGKRIREMARTADKFTVEQRIERIAGIFNTFRNPDKETVLTPWRVVNMHMSDCLGGWCFYDEEFKHTLEVPRYVDQGQVTKDVFSSEARILEINSKSGLYPLYVAYNIYRTRVEAAKAKYGEIGHAFAMQLWDLTIENNILVICKTPMARSITRRTLVGFRDTTVNAKYYKNLIENISQKPAVVINTFKDGKHFWGINHDENMTIDAIIGNPPYQIVDGGNGGSSVPIYHKFVEIAKATKSKYVSLIMPARWYSGGKGLDTFRDEMINDKSICILHDYLDSATCFGTVAIEGGICYFLRNAKSQKPCDIVTHIKDGSISSRSRRYLCEEGTDIFIRDERCIDILSTVIRSQDFKSFGDLVFPRNPFDLKLRPSDFVKANTPNAINLFGRFDNTRQWRFLRPNFEIDRENGVGELIDKCKVFVSKADGAAGQIGNPIPARIIGKAVAGYENSVCTETFLAIGTFESHEEANNVVKYMQTKFFRFLVGIRKTKNMTRDTYKFAPSLDFKEEWSDKKLYQKYNLSDQQIAFIERMIESL